MAGPRRFWPRLPQVLILPRERGSRDRFDRRSPVVLGGRTTAAGRAWFWRSTIRRPSDSDHASKGRESITIRRRDPPNTDDAIHHDEHLEHCPRCGSEDLEATGELVDSDVEDIPESKVEVRCFRRNVDRSRRCDKRVKGCADLDVPVVTFGPRIRLLSVYARAYLGISLGKTATLLNELFGISISRAGVLGHLRWFVRQFAPVVGELFELRKRLRVVHADETGWPSQGRPLACRQPAWTASTPGVGVSSTRRSPYF